MPPPRRVIRVGGDTDHADALLSSLLGTSQQQISQAYNCIPGDDESSPVVGSIHRERDSAQSAIGDDHDVMFTNDESDSDSESSRAVAAIGRTTALVEPMNEVLVLFQGGQRVALFPSTATNEASAAAADGQSAEAQLTPEQRQALIAAMRSALGRLEESDSGANMPAQQAQQGPGGKRRRHRARRGKKVRKDDRSSGEEDAGDNEWGTRRHHSDDDNDASEPIAAGEAPASVPTSRLGTEAARRYVSGAEVEVVRLHTTPHSVGVYDGQGARDSTRIADGGREGVVLGYARDTADAPHVIVPPPPRVSDGSNINVDAAVGDEDDDDDDLLLLPAATPTRTGNAAVAALAVPRNLGCGTSFTRELAFTDDAITLLPPRRSVMARLLRGQAASPTTASTVNSPPDARRSSTATLREFQLKFSDYTYEAMMALTAAQLKDELRTLGLPLSGPKRVLADRLWEAIHPTQQPREKWTPNRCSSLSSPDGESAANNAATQFHASSDANLVGHKRPSRPDVESSLANTNEEMQVETDGSHQQQQRPQPSAELESGSILVSNNGHVSAAANAPSEPKSSSPGGRLSGVTSSIVGVATRVGSWLEGAVKRFSTSGNTMRPSSCTSPFSNRENDALFSPGKHGNCGATYDPSAVVEGDTRLIASPRHPLRSSTTLAFNSPNAAVRPRLSTAAAGDI